MVPSPLNLAGGAYCVPQAIETEFYNEYINYVFGSNRGRLALTECPLVLNSGISYSPVFIDFDLRYPMSSDGQ